ncbi:MAG TPA: TolC family protein [Phycisphaerales bacterium]|nr:TolC family protein [Phycisphaerales bacterium]
MDTGKSVALVGCLLVGGCAGPLGRSWDDPIYRDIRSRYQHRDETASRMSVESEPTEPAEQPLEGLRSLSVDDAIRVAINNAPSLRRAGYRVDLAAGRVTQAGLYPNPTIAFDGEGLGGAAGSGGETVYRVEQEILLGGKLDKARRVAEADRLSAQAGFVAEEFAIASRVTRAYYAAVAARERLKNRRELLDLADRLLEAATAQVDAGAATEPDRLRAEIVQEQARIDHESARLAYEASRRALSAAMGLDEPIDLPLSSRAQRLPVLADQGTILEAALEDNTRITLAQLAIDRAQKAHVLARAEAVPDLVVSAGPRYSDIENETTLDVGVGIEVPLFDRNQGNIRAALAERLSSAAALREVQLELISEVSRAYADYESALNAVDRYNERLLPKAERTLEMTRQAYERGKTDYLRLLDAQQVMVEARIAYVDALQRLHEAAALLRELAQDETPWRGSSAETENGEYQK